MTINSKNIHNTDKIIWNSSLVFLFFNRNNIRHLYGDMVDVLDKDGNVVGQKEVMIHLTHGLLVKALIGSGITKY